VNHRETVRSIHQRLPHLKRREVAEVIEVLAELWLEALAQPGGVVTVADLGKLTAEVQTLRSAGAIRQRLEATHGKAAPQRLKRVYLRFRPTAKLRNAIQTAYIEEGANE
jgi:nucleoid DNA-binding protein